MKNAKVTYHGSAEFDAHSAMIYNSENLWANCLMDKHDDAGMVVNSAGTLRHEDELQISEKVTAVRKRRLNGILDLMDEGLTRPFDIGTQLMGFENVNDFPEAEQSMNPTALQNNNTNFGLDYTPLPITHSGFTIPWRQQGFSYKNALGLTASVRAVAERLERTLFAGNGNIVVTVNGSQSQVHGYTTHPDRAIQSISDWSNTANLGNILTNVQAMLKKAFLDCKVEEVDSMVMYVAPNIWNVLDGDYSTQKGEKTFLERIKSYSAIRDVKVGEYLADGNVLLVQMSEETVELGMASDIITVPHSRNAPTENQVFTTYAAMQAAIKSDRNNTTGIVHGVPA